MVRPTNDPPSLPASVPHAFLSTARLRADGYSARALAEGVHEGAIIRVRRGRYLAAGAHPVVVDAATRGARVDCISLLPLYGVFVRDTGGPPHVQVSNGASRLPPRRTPAVVHWRRSRAGAEDVIADVVEALAQAVRCQDPRAAIATLDSAWHRRLVDEHAIDDVFSLLPRKYRPLRALLDPRCESGPESLVRLMLRVLGCRVRPQAEIAGVGFVDFLVDGWLIVECDSRAHHDGWDAHRRDRRRDAHAVARGYTPIRLLAEDILYRPDEVFSILRAALAAHA